MTDKQYGSDRPMGQMTTAGTDPAAIAERAGVEFEHRTFEHDAADHPEAGSAGLAVLGVTDPEGSLLLLVQPEHDHAVLPHATVAADDYWAETARTHVESLADIAIEIDGVRRVRRVEHVIAGDEEPRETTHHVVFDGSIAEPNPPTTQLCVDNDWRIGWYEAPPFDAAAPTETAGEEAARDDVRLFLG